MGLRYPAILLGLSAFSLGVGCAQGGGFELPLDERDAAVDASRLDDAGDSSRVDAASDADAYGDAGRPAPDAGLPVDGYVPPADAGRDSGPVLPVCMDEVCNGLDDDCDGVVDNGAACPCDVAHLLGGSYLLCGPPRSFAAARASCQSLGYDLAVIEDPDEDAAIYGEIASRGFLDTWIGLSDAEDEDTWVWVDGSLLTYEHWDSGEPNDGGTHGEDCALMMTSPGREAEWDDRPCNTDRPYVCEAPPVPVD